MTEIDPHILSVLKDDDKHAITSKDADIDPHILSVLEDAETTVDDPLAKPLSGPTDIDRILEAAGVSPTPEPSGILATKRPDAEGDVDIAAMAKAARSPSFDPLSQATERLTRGALETAGVMATGSLAWMAGSVLALGELTAPVRSKDGKLYFPSWGENARIAAERAEQVMAQITDNDIAPGRPKTQIGEELTNLVSGIIDAIITTPARKSGEGAQIIIETLGSWLPDGSVSKYIKEDLAPAVNLATKIGSEVLLSYLLGHGLQAVKRTGSQVRQTRLARVLAEEAKKLAEERAQGLAEKLTQDFGEVHEAPKKVGKRWPEKDREAVLNRIKLQAQKALLDDVGQALLKEMDQFSSIGGKRLVDELTPEQKELIRQVAFEENYPKKIDPYTSTDTVLERASQAAGVEPKHVEAFLQNERIADLQVAFDLHKLQTEQLKEASKSIRLTPKREASDIYPKETSPGVESPTSPIKFEAFDKQAQRHRPFSRITLARKRALKIAADSGELFEVKRLPDKSGYYLERIEGAENIYLSRGGTPYKDKRGATRRRNALKARGILSEVIPVDEGFGVQVTGYTEKGYVDTIRKLKGVKKEKPVSKVSAEEKAFDKAKEKLQEKPTDKRKVVKVERVELTADEARFARKRDVVAVVETLSDGTTRRRLVRKRLKGKSKARPPWLPKTESVVLGKVITRDIANEFNKYYTNEPIPNIKKAITNDFGELAGKDFVSAFDSVKGSRAERLTDALSWVSDRYRKGRYRLRVAPDTTEVHAGPNIPKDVLRRIEKLALEAGEDITKYLMKKGYSAEDAKYVADLINPRSSKAVDLEPRIPPDGAKNRRQLRHEIQRMGVRLGYLKIAPGVGKSRGAITLGEELSVLKKTGVDLEKALNMTERARRKMLRDSELLKRKAYSFIDEGGKFNEVSNRLIGKNFTDDLTTTELVALRNKLAGEHTATGVPLTTEKGMRPPTSSDLEAIAKIPKDAKVSQFTTMWAMFKNFGEPVREAIFRPIQHAAAKAASELGDYKTGILDMEKKLGIGKAERDRVLAHAYWQQEQAHAALVKMKVKRPVLTEAELKYYNYIRSIFDDVFEKIQRARVAMGKEPIEKVDNYFTFFRMLQDRNLSGQAILYNSKAEIKRATVRSTRFGPAKSRVDSALPLVMDLHGVVYSYLNSALRHIHVAPEIARLGMLIDRTWNISELEKTWGKDAIPGELLGKETFSLRSHNPEAYVNLQRFLNHAAGVKINSRLSEGTIRLMAKLRQNVVYAMLSYNIRSALIQPTALRNTFTIIPTKDVFAAMSDVVLGNKKATGASDILKLRSFDQTAEFIYNSVKASRLGGIQQRIAETGIKPLQFLDEVTANVTWLAARRYAKRVHPEWGERKLANYADDVVEMTQASGHAIHVSDIQRHDIGKFFTMLQTFVINDWNFLVKEVAGYKTAKPTRMKVKTVLKYLVATTIFNILYEDIPSALLSHWAGRPIKINSPFPTPINAFLEEANSRGGTLPGAVARGLLEMTEPIPLVGGTARYGSVNPPQDAYKAILDWINGRPVSIKPGRAAGTLFGIPGTAQAYKTEKLLRDLAGQ